MNRILHVYVHAVATWVTFFAAPSLAFSESLLQKHSETAERPKQPVLNRVGDCGELFDSIRVVCRNVPDGTPLVEALGEILAAQEKLKCRGKTEEGALVIQALEYEAHRKRRDPDKVRAVFRSLFPILQQEQTDGEKFMEVIRDARRQMMAGASKADLQAVATRMESLSSVLKASNSTLSDAAMTYARLLHGRDVPIERIKTLPVFDEQPRHVVDNICGPLPDRHKAYFTPRSRMMALELALALSLRRDRERGQSSISSQTLGRDFHEMDIAGTRVRMLERLVARDMEATPNGFRLIRTTSSGTIDDFAAEAIHQLKPVHLHTRPRHGYFTDPILARRDGDDVVLMINRVCGAGEVSNPTVSWGKEVAKELAAKVTARRRIELGGTELRFTLPQAHQDSVREDYAIHFACNGRDVLIELVLAPKVIAPNELEKLIAPREKPDYEHWDRDGIRRGVTLSLTANDETVEKLKAAGYECSSAERVDLQVEFKKAITEQAVDFVDILLPNRHSERDLQRLSRDGFRTLCRRQRDGSVHEQVVLADAQRGEDHSLNFAELGKAIAAKNEPGEMLWILRGSDAVAGSGLATLQLAPARVLVIANPSLTEPALPWPLLLQSQDSYEDMVEKTGVDSDYLPHSQDFIRHRRKLLSGLQEMSGASTGSEPASDGLYGDRRSLYFSYDRTGIRFPSLRFDVEAEDRRSKERPGFNDVLETARRYLTQWEPHFSQQKISDLMPLMEITEPNALHRAWLHQAYEVDVLRSFSPYSLGLMSESHTTARVLAKQSPNRAAVGEVVTAPRHRDYAHRNDYYRLLEDDLNLELFLSAASTRDLYPIFASLRPEERAKAHTLLSSRVRSGQTDSITLAKLLMFDSVDEQVVDASVPFIVGDDYMFTDFVFKTPHRAAVFGKAMDRMKDEVDEHAASVLNYAGQIPGLDKRAIEVLKNHIDLLMRDRSERDHPEDLREYYTVLGELGAAGSADARHALSDLVADPTVLRHSELREDVWKWFQSMIPSEPGREREAYEHAVTYGNKFNYGVRYLGSRGGAAVPYARRLLESESPLHKSWGLQILSRTGPFGEHAEEVRAALKSSEPALRSAALDYANRGGMPPDVEEEIVTLAKDAVDENKKMPGEDRLKVGIAGIRYARSADNQRLALQAFHKGWRTGGSFTGQRMDWKSVPAELKPAVAEIIFNDPPGIAMSDFVLANMPAVRSTLHRGDAGQRRRVWQIVGESMKDIPKLESLSLLVLARESLGRPDLDGEEIELIYRVIEAGGAK